MKWCIIIFGFTFFLSCSDDNPNASLTSAERKLIDSLVKDQKLIIAHDIDSLCKLNFDARVQSLVDSIMEKRLEEQKRLLGK